MGDTISMANWKVWTVRGFETTVSDADAVSIEHRFLHLEGPDTSLATVQTSMRFTQQNREVAWFNFEQIAGYKMEGSAETSEVTLIFPDGLKKILVDRSSPPRFDQVGGVALVTFLGPNRDQPVARFKLANVLSVSGK